MPYDGIYLRKSSRIVLDYCVAKYVAKYVAKSFRKNITHRITSYDMETNKSYMLDIIP